MTDLPKGWAWTTLGEVCEVSPRDPALSEESPFVPMSSVAVGTRYPVSYEARGSRGGVRAQANDILFARITPCLENGKVAQLPQDSPRTGGSTEFVVVRPGGAVEPAYAYYWCLHPDVRDRAQHQMAGVTGRMRLSGNDLAAFEFALPPLAEQRRIVEVLEDHLSRLDAAEVTLAACERKVKVLAAQAIDYSRSVASDAGEEAAPPSAADVVDGELPSLPAGWSWLRLGEIAEVVGGITKDSNKQGDESLAVHPYLRVANVQAGYLNLEHVTEIRATPAQVKKLTLRDGDVLLNEGGDRDKLGRGWVWEDQLPGCLHQNHVFRARVLDGAIAPRLIAWHANSFGRSWFIANGKQSVNLASVSLTTIRAFPIPIPPVDCQPAIVEQITGDLGQFERLITGIGVAKARSTALRRSLLRAAFNGELVDQDPDDEPATVALARVRTEPKPARKRATKRTATAAAEN